MSALRAHFSRGREKCGLAVGQYFASKVAGTHFAPGLLTKGTATAAPSPFLGPLAQKLHPESDPAFCEIAMDSAQSGGAFD